jgi:hypothetical protein
MSDTHLTAPTRFIEVDGDRFAYRRWGKPSGVPLFFVPHFRAGLDHWDPLLTDGLAAGREVRHRPPVDVAQRPIKDQYYRRPNEWAPNRPTIAYIRNTEIGLTLFELTENVRVRRTGMDRYVRISDLPPTRRYAPQAPGEADETRDMPTGRFVLRAYSPRHDAPWQHERTEGQKGEFVTIVSAIADALEEAVPVIVKQVEDAEQRRREEQAREKIERRRRQARERAEARQRARQAAKEELRSIVKAWNDAFALEAFFTELSRCAAALEGDDRAELEARIQAARNLAGGQDAIDRFTNWKLPPDDDGHDGNGVDDEAVDD